MKILKEELVDLWNVVCPNCQSEILNKNGKYKNRQRFICLDCGLTFTSYSKTILDSTKLSNAIWETIIECTVNRTSLKELSKETNISITSLCNIRQKLLKLLQQHNQFDQILQDYYHNPKEDTSLFFNHQEITLYYFEYNDKMNIAFFYDSDYFVSKAISNKALIKFQNKTYYPNLKLTAINDSDDNKILKYSEELKSYLKSFYGIKASHLSLYTNLFDLIYQNSMDEIIDYILTILSTPVKK